MHPISSSHPALHYASLFLADNANRILGAYSFLFCLMGLVAVKSFRIIRDQMEHLLNASEKADLTASLHSGQVVTSELKKWKRQYLVLYEYCAQINRMFNLPLLVDVCHIFVNFITELFYLVNETGAREWPLNVLSSINLISDVTFLFMVAFVADRIKSEVGECMLHVTCVCVCIS